MRVSSAKLLKRSIVNDRSIDFTAHSDFLTFDKYSAARQSGLLAFTVVDEETAAIRLEEAESNGSQFNLKDHLSHGERVG
jgi:hypothetical protein